MFVRSNSTSNTDIIRPNIVHTNIDACEFQMIFSALSIGQKYMLNLQQYIVYNLQ
jgi:hypothetical protein